VTAGSRAEDLDVTCSVLRRIPGTASDRGIEPE
jgi:hypothetical protein